jgi:hypothetical protein
MIDKNQFLDPLESRVESMERRLAALEKASEPEPRTLEELEQSLDASPGWREGARVALWLSHGGLKAGTVAEVNPGGRTGVLLVQLDRAGKLEIDHHQVVELPGEWR